MLSGVGLSCFAASYGLALIVELLRLLKRSRVGAVVALGLTVAGLIAHTIYLYYQAVVAHGSPLSSERDWYLVAAWVLAGVYVYLVGYDPRPAFGVFVLPLVLGLLGAAVWFASREPFPVEPAARIWGTIHGAALLLATVAVLVGFAAGLMYLWQESRLKNKTPASRGIQLPSLEWLQRANSRTIVASVLLLSVGLLSGIVLNLINSVGAERLPWSDPIVLSTLVMFGWMVLALGFTAFYKPVRRGGRVAYLTVVSFVFLLIALSVGLFLPTEHGGTNPAGARARSQPAAEQHEAGGAGPGREGRR